MSSSKNIVSQTSYVSRSFESNLSSNNNSSLERRCENSDCNVSKLLLMVPKRKASEFVTKPHIMEKPMLINDFTTIFQVDGNSEKLNDIPTRTFSNRAETVFRIVPNTHAHIVNYVVIDGDGETLRKINKSDPITMRKLLESQKISAEQMLKKLMSRHGSSSVLNTNVLKKASASNFTQQQIEMANPTSTLNSPNLTVTMPSILTPLPIVSHLKHSPSNKNINSSIINTTTKLSPHTTTSAMIPLITPVPLASLQSNSKTHSTFASDSTSICLTEFVDKPNFDQMQSEIQELRRTVALLAKAQTKNRKHQKETFIANNDQRLAKRSRI